MKKEIADKWVEALRSGKYKQGTNVLKSGDRFCCLGVLCDISGVSEWGKDDEYFGQISYLSHKVQQWAGMHSNYGSIKEDSIFTIVSNSLMSLNDNGKSFEEIADVIEKNWKFL